jgi:hypothetical protein
MSDASSEAAVPVEGIELFQRFQGRVGYVAAGIGVRNTGRGTISVTVPRGASILHAYLYWTILDDDTPNPLNNVVTVNGIRVTGTLIGQGPEPNWPPATTGYSYRADVRFKLRNSGASMGGGVTYGIFVGGMSTYHDTGEDPFTAPIQPPMAEYAGLVVVYSAPWLPGGTLEIFDGYFMWGGSASFTYTWPARTSGGARFSHMIGDGQMNINPFNKNVDFGGTIIDTTCQSGYDPSITSRATYVGSLADTDTFNVGSLVSTGGGATTITWNCPGEAMTMSTLIFQTGTDSPP